MKATLVPRMSRVAPPLLFSEWRQNGGMRCLRAAIGVIWVLSFVAGRALWVSAQPSAITATSAEITAQAKRSGRTVAGASLMEPHDSSPSNDPRVDLFGNEIEEAVADYRIDLRGGIYERHSPETEVARLGSPTT